VLVISSSLVPMQPDRGAGSVTSLWRAYGDGQALPGGSPSVT
jgi:hypothetical protein